jgi:hypothetical protein
VSCLDAACVVVGLSTGDPCDDGDACTTQDRCFGGLCAGKPVDCDDGNPCTDESCDPLTGCAQTNNDKACDDGNPCTFIDTCAAGQCVGFDNQCPCDGSAACAGFDDGDPCNGVLVCGGGFCIVQPGSVPDCAALAGPCLDASCDPLTGECVVSAWADGEACDDGDSCSVGEQCQGGECIPPPGTGCDDGNSCTFDVCTGAGVCSHVVLDAGPCEDGDPCTSGDTCIGDVCKAGQAWNCDDGDPCTEDICVEGGGCGHELAVGAPCEDGDVCTAGDACDAAGACISGAPNPCDDGNSCTLDTCQSEFGCLHGTLANGKPCDDGDTCTIAEACQAGQCKATSTLNCDDGNSCTIDACTVAGACVYAFVPDGTACNDGDACTGGDTCMGGVCQVGTLVVCNPCDGQPDWSPCEDYDGSTVGDACLGGECRGFSKVAYTPDPNASQAAFKAAHVDKTTVVAIGVHTNGAGVTYTWGAQLSGAKTPAKYGLSERMDTEYVAFSHGMVLGTGGAISAFSGPVWNSEPPILSALDKIAPASEYTAIWGTSLSGVPGKERDVWTVAGADALGNPWVAECTREGIGGGGSTWFCSEQSAMSSLAKHVAGVWGQTGPCNSPNCVGLDVADKLLLADGAASQGNYLLQFKSGSWVLTYDVPGVPGDQWRAVSGEGSDVWAVGTRGLVGRRSGSTWAPVALPGTVEASTVDLLDVTVVAGRVYATARRVHADFGTAAVDLYLVTWPSDFPSSARWIPLNSLACTTTACAGAPDGSSPNQLNGVAVAPSGVYLVGREQIGAVERAVLYHRPLQ